MCLDFDMFSVEPSSITLRITFPCLTIKGRGEMDTNLCVIRLGKGERVNDALGKILDTPDMTTIGAFAV